MFLCRKSGSRSLGWELAPVDSFARAAWLCLAHHPGLTSGSDWLASRQPHVFCERQEAARGQAGSVADAQREPLFSGTWGLCANRAVRSHGVLEVTGQGQ